MIRFKWPSKPNVLSHLLLRGDTVFPAFRSIYLQSRPSTEEFKGRIGEIWPHGVQGTAYRRLSILPWSRKKKPVVAVLIGAVGRFGNAVIQVTNAAQIARQLGSHQVLYFRFDEVPDSEFQSADNMTFRRVRLFQEIKSRPDIIWRTDALFRGGLAFEPGDESAQSIASTLRTALGLSKGTEPSEGILTIHLRGGDIFGSNPHRDYGQPPLSFYLALIKSEHWKQIILVSEDDHNPCFRHIKGWCEASGMPLRQEGQDSLTRAIETLGSARNVALSHGTFGPAALFLQPTSRRVFFFGQEPHPLLERSAQSLHRVVDLRGQYMREVMSRNWTNSSQQRELMVSYPESCLGPIEALRHR